MCMSRPAKVHILQLCVQVVEAVLVTAQAQTVSEIIAYYSIIKLYFFYWASSYIYYLNIFECIHAYG